MKYLLLFSVLFLTSYPALSQITVGGGCIVREDLCEEDEYKHVIALSVKTELAQLKAMTAPLPGLPLYLDILAGKDWYLESRPFNPKMCGPQGVSEESSNDYEIAACQVDFEVRISSKFWAKASSEQKMKLVLHELMLSHAIKRGLTAAHVRKATYLILTGMKEPFATRMRLAATNLPLFNLQVEDDVIIRFAKDNKALFSEPGAMAQLEKNWKQVALHVSFRADYSEMAQYIFLNLIERAKEDIFFKGADDQYLTTIVIKELRAWEFYNN